MNGVTCEEMAAAIAIVAEHAIDVNIAESRLRAFQRAWTHARPTATEAMRRLGIETCKEASDV